MPLKPLRWFHCNQMLTGIMRVGTVTGTAEQPKCPFPLQLPFSNWWLSPAACWRKSSVMLVALSKGNTHRHPFQVPRPLQLAPLNEEHWPPNLIMQSDATTSFCHSLHKACDHRWRSVQRQTGEFRALLCGLAHFPAACSNRAPLLLQLKHLARDWNHSPCYPLRTSGSYLFVSCPFSATVT